MYVIKKIDDQERIELTQPTKSLEAILTLEHGVLVAANTQPFDALAAVQAVRDERL
jgi:hypothetical protein